MRRLALIGVALIAGVTWWVTAAAGAIDSHTYKIDMFYAFGIVYGSDLRIGGVNSGSVTGLDINGQKRAVATVSLSGPLSVLGKDTRCASQPQSLIAEYFISCNPKGPPLPNGGTIPAGTKFTLDLYVNTGSNQDVTAAQNYLTFTNSILQVVSPSQAGPPWCRQKLL